MSIFGKDRQFMSDLELEEAGASLIHDRPAAAHAQALSSQSHRPAHTQQPQHRTSQDSITNRQFGDVFSQLSEAYTSKKAPEMANTTQPPQPQASRYTPVSLPQQQFDSEVELIDFNADSAPRPGNGGGGAPYQRRAHPPQHYSPVPSDHPSDMTEGTWDSRAALTGVPPSTGTGRPHSRNPNGNQPQMGVGGAGAPQPLLVNHSKSVPGTGTGSELRMEPSGHGMSQSIDRNNGYPPSYHRGYSTGERASKAIAPINEDRFETLPLHSYGGGGTLGGMEDDRRSHLSMATSMMSTVPLSTQPAATKTMSGLYALLLVMLGVAVSAGDLVSREQRYSAKYAEFYAMYVFGVGTLASLYVCLACIYAKRRGNAPIDHHNGSIYIRIGAAVFCLGSLAHSAIILAETFQYQKEDCYIYARLGSISLRALFQVSQLFVVLVHSKVCIQAWNGLARLLLAHMIAADFFMWFKLTLKETEESIVVNVPRHYHSIRTFCDRDYANQFTDMEEESTPILVPMAVAYCLIAGCMLFSMWRNIGKDYSIEHREESCEEHEKQLTFQCREGVVGVMAGVLAIMASISVLVLYIMFSNDRSIAHYLVAIYQVYSAGWLCLLILLLPLATAALKRHKKQDHYHNSLNRPILIVTTGGAFAYCILNLMSAAVLLLSRFSWVALATLCGYSVHALETAFQTVYLLDGLRRCPRKRGKRASKSFVVFFLLVNVSLWITIIFELKETALNPLQEQFYGIIHWTVMLNFVGPVASLYRFHSVCCLLDVWKFAY